MGKGIEAVIIEMLFLLTLFFTVACAADRNPDENTGISNPNLFEGDIALTPRQRLSLKLGLGGISRGATADSSLLWPNGVLPYIIDSTLSSQKTALDAIDAAMKDWSRYTCIRFQRRTWEYNYVRFTRGNGCWSWYGRRRIGSQDISLDYGCWTKGIVAHEIAHALGFYHEQSRPDRDYYVTINTNNIQSGKESNFWKFYINSLGVPYDYGSVMHYGRFAFSKNGLPTVIPKQPPKQPGVTIGQRNGPSDRDIQQMNRLYKCSCRDSYSTYCPRYWYIHCSSSPWTKNACRKTCGLC